MDGKRLNSIYGGVPALLASLLAMLFLVPGSAQALAKTQPVAVHKLIDNIYEFDYVVPTGNGPHQKVGVHRVVRVDDSQPISSDTGIFLVHGDAWNFNGAFLGGTSRPDSLPVFLAEHGIDVWGIDLGWTLVPANTTNFSFMKEWGLQRDINDIETAISFARSVRVETDSPGNRMTLLDWSRGGWTGYALLNQESQKAKEQRQVGSYISVDNFFKVDDPTTRSTMCSLEASTNTDIANGIYAYSHSFDVQVGQLAKSDPGGPSSLFGPPYTNLQASLTLGAATFQFGSTFAQYYHFVGGTFPGGDISRIPNGLTYTKISRWNDFLISATPFESTRMIADTYGISCGDTTTAFDDHLKDVTVPVFYVGAGGGFGRGGLFTLTLLGSEDVSSKIISFFPPKQAAFDFAHVDPFNARDARDLVWSPILGWLSQHGGQDE